MMRELFGEGRKALHASVMQVSHFLKLRRVDAFQNRFFAQDFYQVIQARSSRAAGAGQARRMHQDAYFYA
jgi:hypothetical protein